MSRFRLLCLPLLCLLLCACGGGGGGGSVSLPPVEDPDDPPPLPKDEGPWALDLAQGQALYVEKCQGCHQENGRGGYGPALDNTFTCPPCESFDRLWRRIDEYMPLRNPQACDADCSRHIASWILNGFSTAPSCTLEFRYDSITADRYRATLRIANFRGKPVADWRLGLRLPEAQQVSAARNASFVQDGREVLLQPPAGSGGIADGAALELGIEGSHGGATPVPADLRLEAAPCFTAPPG